MNRYKDKVKQYRLDEIMQGRKPINYSELQQLEKDGILEDFDVIRVLSDLHDDMYIFYEDEGYSLITKSRKRIIEIDRKDLMRRRFLLSRCKTNGVQNLLQKKGTEAFEKLSTEELIETILNQEQSLFKGEER